MPVSRSDHISRVFDTAVDLNHLVHPFTELDPDHESPSLANRLGAVALLVLSIATLGTLTGFYLYRAHKKVVHMEKAEERDKVISHLYKQNTPKKQPNTSVWLSEAQKEAQAKEVAASAREEARSTLLKGVAANREEAWQPLSDHQRAVVKATVVLERGNVAKALEQVKSLGKDGDKGVLTPEEQQEFLKVAVRGDNISIVSDLLEAFLDCKTGIEKTEEKKWEQLLREDFPWEEIKNKKMFDALWNQVVDKDQLTDKASIAIAKLIFTNNWADRAALIVKYEFFDFPEDCVREETFDALVEAYAKDEDKDLEFADFLLKIVMNKDWISKVESIWKAYPDVNIAWDKSEVKSKALFDALWAKQKESASSLSGPKKKALLELVVKNNWIDRIDPILEALGEVEFPWKEVQGEEIFNTLWTRLPENKERLKSEEKDAIFRALVRNDGVGKILDVWTALKSVEVPWDEIRSPEMHNKLRDSVTFKNDLHENAWLRGILFNLRSIEIAEAFKEKGGKSWLFGDKSALHTCTDPEIAKYLISKEGLNIWVDSRVDNKSVVPLYTTPPAVQKVLIENGANVNIPHPDGYTLLHGCKDPEMVKLLLEKGAKVNTQDAEGRTALHLCDDPEIMKMLLEYDADINIEDNLGKTPFAELTNPKLLKMLAQVKVKNSWFDSSKGATLLHQCKDLELVKRLILHGANIEAKSDGLGTPLFSNQSIEVRKFLIEKGADVNTQNNDGWTVLLSECQTCGDSVENFNFIQFLLENGANPNIKNIHGRAPLHESTGINLITLLLQHGADIDVEENQGMTPLLHVCPVKYGVTEYYVENGADVTKKSKDGRTLLHFLRDNVDLAEKLVREKGMDMNARDDRGNTPLMCALMHNDFLIAKKWIDLGADVKNINLEGKNCLYFCKDPELIQLLVNEKGLDPNGEDFRGNRPIHNVESLEELKELIKNRADPTLVNEKGQTVLFRIQNKNNAENLADYLIDKCGLDFNQKDNQGRIPLHVTRTMTSYWVGKGVDVNARDNEGKTPLHYSVHEWDVKQLLTYGTDPSLTDNLENVPPITVEHPEWFK